MNAAPRPVVRPLPGWRHPLEVLPLFRDDDAPVLLLSAGPEGAAEEIARYSFLCSGPFGWISWDAWIDAGDPFAALDAALRPHACAPAEPWPFAGGAIGWLGYDARLAVEPVLRRAARRPSADEPRLPTVLFGLYGWTIAWDHARRAWAVIATGAPETGSAARASRAREVADGVARRLAAAPEAAGGDVPRRAGLARVRETSLPRAAYLGRVAQVRSLIEEGEVYQVNLSQRLDLAPPADPVAAFAAAARVSPSPFAAYLDMLDMGGARVVCASPERFVSLRGRVAETRPIKGTRPRGRSAEQDARLRDALVSSEKDRAENIMIVDLERNDLGRVCRPGTVRVQRLCALESYASVHHLVSVVRGELPEGAGRADLLRALFPGGSMTGAPKVRAMQLIDEMEPVPRGLYAGSLGYLSFSGEMDLNIVIRTLVMAGGRCHLHVGGGIVADSVPADEFAESMDKARSLRRALGSLRERPTGRRGMTRGTGTARRRSAR